MTSERPRLAWHTRDPIGLASRLARLAQAEADELPAGVAARLSIVPGDRDELELESDAAAPRELARLGVELGVAVLAVGWATVELERWGPVEILGDDSLLGARTAAAAVTTQAWGAAFPVLLLEPSTEGRIAARLARHGEGVAAVYLVGTADRRQADDAEGEVAARARAAPGSADRATGCGPFGSSSLAADPRYGPFLVTCRGPFPRLPRPRTIDP